ncbi:Na+/H+ antiporter [Streptomyces reniochalinae]|uniref:Na+/H+ antiporter n=1 Tax=Streptomyces reniochalinae TaxID=2250578 RepID=A0A367EGU7_9ACTN|nr:Na+/H+ antiporter [Streptomyces reniochalinae]RCG16577.1 Na+/H+ antiporter [Streptomyces reniochalinae]
MDQLALFFALLLAAVVMVPLGDKLNLPSPVLMTLFGGVLAVVPSIPNVSLPPEYILPLVLPPLIYAAAQRTSWRQFAANKRPIFLMAVALVFVTTAAVAAVANALVPGLGLAGAVALGALVAPPDPVAATAVAGNVGLPRRLVSALEGEGLFNDVTAITLYHVAIAAAVTGSFSLPVAAGELVLSGVVAVAVGLGLGWLANKLMSYLGDATLQTGLTLLVPFASYVLAEELMGSGVLGVLTTALYLASGHAVDADDVQGRLAGQTFWQIVDTLVTGIAFGLIGLELHTIFGTVQQEWRQLLPAAGAVVGVVVVLRLLWLLPTAWLAQRLHRRKDLDEDIPRNWRETVVVWWSGMRGVASVALALAVPLSLEPEAGGGAFPGREAIIFIAFAVVIVTLVFQGLTLPWLVNRLNVQADSAAEREVERQLAVRVAKAARKRLREIEEVEDLPEEVSEALARRVWDMGARISPDIVDDERRAAHRKRVDRLQKMRRLNGELLSAARHEVIAARGEAGVDPEVVDRVLHQLDVRSFRGV